jgi:type I restriction enzyme M protein
MLDDIKRTLWAAADKLRANMDAAEYKHLVLGLIFVKYVSDTFAARRAELERKFADLDDEYFLDDPELIPAELEDRDYYKEVNVFWVPEEARWEALRAAAKQPDIGRRIDDALALIENENPKLKGILDKRYARAHLPDGKLGELVDLISTIGFGEDASQARDVLGQVYEYFLGQFASAEGKKGGQFYTPASIVKTLVAVLAPHDGKVYDPCCGSGGMFVQSEKFIEAHGGKLGDVSIYGQESNPTTWRLAAMNLALRGIDFNLGREPADTFTRNQHPDLRADFILANPPFNISDWWHGSLEGDPRWVYGTPPQGNANYAWLQHMLYHLKPNGRAGIVLANGSMSSSQNSEGDIRRAMVEADVVEVMIALPGQLFFNTQIPACLWFLRKPPSPLGRGNEGEGKTRQGEVLFIDARKLGRMISRVQAELTDEVIDRIAGTVAAWRGENLPSPSGRGAGGEGTGSEAVQTHSKPSLPEDLLAFARQLRQQSTDAEQWLWQALRDRRMAGMKFRRQHPINPYVLDFYCHELKLAVELDGGQHNSDPGRARDRQRSRFLEQQGIRVLRFWNNQVFQEAEAVLEAIFRAVTVNRPSPLTPLPEGEGNGLPDSSIAANHAAAPLPLPSGEGRGEGTIYQDIPGYCRSVKLAEIAEHGHVLTPGRYVGAEAVEDDDEAFADKMQKLTEKLGEQMAKGAELDQLIRQKLGGLGYEF